MARLTQRTGPAGRIAVLFRGRTEGLPALPDGWRPRTVAGRALVFLSYARLPRTVPAWLTARVHGTDHLGLHLAVESPSGRPASWLLARRTSSWVEARRAPRRGESACRRSSFHFEQSPLSLELAVHDGAALALRLRAEPHPESRSQLFPSARAALSFLESCLSDVCPRPSARVAAAERLRLDGRAVIEPLDVRECETPLLAGGPGPSPLLGLASFEPDSAFRLVERRLVPTRAASRPPLRVVIGRGNRRPAISS